MNKVIYNTIIRFFKNECSEEERLLIIKWVNESQEHAEQFFRWEELYHLGNNSEKGNDLAIRKAEKKLYERIEIEKSHQWFFSTINRWVKYAAVNPSILAISGLTLWYFVADSQEKWITASTTNGETLEITLPDNSKVWLNENSILKYPEHFTKEKRELHLTGEAYFEVTKNKHIPFKVHTDELDVKVLGTKFNFRNYQDDLEAKVCLLEGKVALSTQQKETILHSDQQALLVMKTVILLISNTKAAYSAEWTNDRRYFDEALLPDIVKELERSYNIKITIAAAALNSVRFYGNFRRREQSIREIMDVLSSTDKMTYTIEGKNIVITLPE